MLQSKPSKHRTKWKKLMDFAQSTGGCGDRCIGDDITCGISLFAITYYDERDETRSPVLFRICMNPYSDEPPLIDYISCHTMFNYEYIRYLRERLI